jgi:glycosyltransferase involved in cell wall biosynthesis
MAATPTRPETVAFVFLDCGEGGAQRVTLEMARRFDPQRFRPVLVCARTAGPMARRAVEAGVPVHCLDRLHARWDWRAVAVLRRALRNVDARIVHTSTYSRVAPYAWLAARLAGTPVIVAHEHARPGRVGRLRRLADEAMGDWLRWIAVSDADRGRLVREGADPGSIEVVHNGVDTTSYRPAPRAPAREELGLPAGAPVIVVPARLVPRKGHVDLLAAVPRIARRHPDLVVLLAGGGPMESVLAALVDGAELGRWVRVLGHCPDLRPLLAAADLAVLPSRLEGHPVALLEALAAGTPVVATRVGGLEELVDEGRTGRLVPPRNPAALAEAVLAVLADSEARAAMGVAARRAAETRFPIQAMADAVQAAYSRWLDEARSGVGAGLPRLAEEPAG